MIIFRLFQYLDEKHVQNKEEFIKKSAEFIRLSNTFNDSIPKALTTSSIQGTIKQTTTLPAMRRITPPVTRVDSISVDLIYVIEAQKSNRTDRLLNYPFSQKISLY